MKISSNKLPEEIDILKKNNICFVASITHASHLLLDKLADLQKSVEMHDNNSYEVICPEVIRMITLWQFTLDSIRDWDPGCHILKEYLDKSIKKAFDDFKVKRAKP